MKPARFITTIALAMAVSGCFKEDLSNCHNAILHFSLQEGGNEVFHGNISAVDVMVYDAAGLFVMNRRVTLSDLARFQGAKFQLDPGAYSFVCWGNIHGNEKYNGIETQPSPTVGYADVMASNKVGSADKVYHAANILTTPTTRANNIPAQYTVVVPDGGKWEGTAHFQSAHRHIEIFVIGFNEQGNTLPMVELTGLPGGLNTLGMAHAATLGTVDSRMNTQTVNVEDRTYAAAQFTTFWFEKNNNIDINIISPSTGQPVCVPISMQDAMAQMTDPNIIEIRIEIGFLNGKVIVNIPNWDSGDVGFEFNNGL
ncbi:hypothetical protein FACS1894159_02250 [Bacteroidia bacterium]|nr:hypothetical protein FACS1894159_02250 [Bacteroidia bacterium]